MSQRGINIVSINYDDQKGSKGSGPTWGDGAKGLSDPQFVPASVLKANMEDFIAILEEALDQADKPESKIRLDEIELTVEITGEGKINLLGSGTTVGGKGAVTLKFKRS